MVSHTTRMDMITFSVMVIVSRRDILDCQNQFHLLPYRFILRLRRPNREMTSIPPKIVCLPEIEKITSQPDFHTKLVQGIADGFVHFQADGFFAAPIQTLGAPPLAPFVKDCENYAGQTCVKSGYFKNNPYYVIKVAAGGHPLPNSGSMQIYSQSTGRLLALLLDEGILTEFRTAAVSALVLKVWLQRCGKDDITKVGMLGTGIQARYQLDAIQHETRCRHLVVYGRTASKVEAYAKEMQSKGWTVDVVADPNELLQQCMVVITTTSARSPVLTTSSDAISTRLLICIGSDAPGKTEVAGSILQTAALRIADSIAQSRQRGEFQSWTDDHTRGEIINLGDWLIQQQPEINADGLVVFDSSGIALQDCVIAQMVYECL